MRTQEIREKFTQYFLGLDHQKIKSSPLIPLDDPTLLFANAGMNQFKDYFTGKAIAERKRAVSIQKCVRAGGKHNDLENVGFTPRHHTFFEMLGNFSFGDYFKKEAIEFSWNFLTKELNIPAEKLLITVHKDDEEAVKLWHTIARIPYEKIYKMDDDTNFWEMGDTGPCGPCSEIFYDHGPEHSTGVPQGKQEIDDEGRYVEIWNLVFMQFEKSLEGGKIVKNELPKPCVDTGAGLERIAALLQGKYQNYDSDAFSPLMSGIEKLTGLKYSAPNTQASFRVVADHVRSSVMLITDGVLPSNEGRGYVLRRIIRRAIRHLSLLGLKEISFYQLVPCVFESLGKEYPDNQANAALATKLLKIEEERFRKTLDFGLDLIQEEMAQLKKGEKLDGLIAFKLYDTFGFPLDLTETILKEKGYDLDQKGFDQAMEKQKKQSRQSSKFQLKEDNAKLFYDLKDQHGITEFLGYEGLVATATLLHIEKIDDLYYLIFNESPFYPEGGGQAGDKGLIRSAEGVVAEIIDTQKPVEGLIVHLSKNADALEVREEYQLEVNSSLRDATKYNHSATHLLQSALIKILGPHVKQAGSSVDSLRLRFDFTHPEALKDEEITRIEEVVNQAIQSALPVSAELMSKIKQPKRVLSRYLEKSMVMKFVYSLWVISLPSYVEGLMLPILKRSDFLKLLWKQLWPVVSAALKPSPRKMP